MDGCAEGARFAMDEVRIERESGSGERGEKMLESLSKTFTALLHFPNISEEGGGWCKGVSVGHFFTVKAKRSHHRGVTVDLLTVSFGSGDSGRGTGPTVCRSWTEGTSSGGPWLPSKEEGATGGGGRGRGGASV